MSDTEQDVRKDLQAIQRECDRLYKVAENELISEREATAAAIFGHLGEIRRRLRPVLAALNEREGKPSTCQEHGGDHDSRNAGSEVDTKKDCTCQTMEHPERPISTRVREDPDCPVHGTADAAPAPEGEGKGTNDPVGYCDFRRENDYRIYVRGDGVRVRAWDYWVPHTDECGADTTVGPREVEPDGGPWDMVRLGLARVHSIMDDLAAPPQGKKDGE